MTEAILLLIIFCQFIIIIVQVVQNLWIRNKDQEIFCKALLVQKNTSIQILQECIKSAQNSIMPDVDEEEEEDDCGFSID